MRDDGRLVAEVAEVAVKEQLSVGHLDGLRGLVTDLGGDFDAVCAEIGLATNLTADGERMLSHRKLLELVDLAARRTRRRDFGLLWGARSSPMLLGPLGVAMANAPTARKAVQLFVDKLPRQNEVLKAALAPLDRRGLELLSLVNQMARPPKLVHPKERNISILLGVLRTLLGDRFLPVEIWLSHPQHADDEAYKRAYGKAPLFDQNVCGLVIKTLDLDRPVPGHRREVFDMAVSHLAQAAPPKLSADDPLATATAVLATNRSYSLGEVAQIMGVHARSLQRRLRDAGVTYSTLRDRARRVEAERLLRDSDRPLMAIAFELDFKDQAAFTRASRRWFGAPPSTARIQLRGSLERGAASQSRTHALAVARRMRSRPEGV
jgi:AraC-like DNA-binding protein